LRPIFAVREKGEEKRLTARFFSNGSPRRENGGLILCVHLFALGRDREEERGKPGAVDVVPFSSSPDVTEENGKRRRRELHLVDAFPARREKGRGKRGKKKDEDTLSIRPLVRRLYCCSPFYQKRRSESAARCSFFSPTATGLEK